MFPEADLYGFKPIGVILPAMTTRVEVPFVAVSCQAYVCVVGVTDENTMVATPLETVAGKEMSLAKTWSQPLKE